MRKTFCNLLAHSLLRCVALSLILAATAHAKDHWRPVGKATLSVLFWDIYTAELFNHNSRFEGIAAPLKLSLTYHRAIDGQRLASETCEQFKGLGYTSAEDMIWCAELDGVFPDVTPGDQLTVILEQNEASLRFNDKLQVQWQNTAMVKKFLAIWLSTESSYPKQVRQLTNTN